MPQAVVNDASDVAASPHPTRLGYAVIATTAVLTAIGLVAIYAASSLKGAEQFGDEFMFLRKQALAAGIGFAIILAAQVVSFKWIERLTLPVYGLTLFLLALIFVPGMYSKVGGAERWLNIPIIGGQPAELTKLALVLFLAKNLSRPACNLTSFRSGVLPNMFGLTLLIALLVPQKDLGTPVVLTGLTFAMLFAAGLPLRYVFFGALGAVAAVILAVQLEPYRMARIMSFLDPWASQQGSGFQIIQSFVAFQNGGLGGVGLGESKQKLFFLPEAHTDFILAVIGEEMGLVGVLVVVCLIGYLCLLGFHIASRQESAHRRFLAFGLTVLVALQAFINIGVTMGLLPTKGMPLPFISSGTSSLLVFLTVIAILARLGRDTVPPQPKPAPSSTAIGGPSGTPRA